MEKMTLQTKNNHSIFVVDFLFNVGSSMFDVGRSFLF